MNLFRPLIVAVLIGIGVLVTIAALSDDAADRVRTETPTGSTWVTGNGDNVVITP